MELTRTDLEGALSRSGFYVVSYKGQDLSFRYKRGNSRNLLILFHGAVDRQVHSVRFQSLLPYSDHQISLFDPTLSLNNSLVAAWYLGGEQFDAQVLLKEFFGDVSRIIEANKKIYFGGSAGGFAALYFSYFDSGSACVAINPQTNLNTYSTKIKPIETYIKSVWRDGITKLSLSELRTINLCSLYSASVNNHVVILQNSADHRHLYGQLIPFLQCVNKSNYRKVNIEIGFWGKIGHSGSVPSSVFLSWIKTLLDAEKWDSDELLLKRHASHASYNAEISSSQSKPNPGEVPRHSAHDFEISRRILESVCGVA